eukprot:scaffold17881_cov68-Cyclotella_meneghiniana.AAC.3
MEHTIFHGKGEGSASLALRHQLLNTCCTFGRGIRFDRFEPGWLGGVRGGEEEPCWKQGCADMIVFGCGFDLA